MWDKLEKEATEKIENALKELKVELKVENHLEEPPPQFGDLAFTGSLALARELKLPPREIGKTILESIQAQKLEYIEKAELAGPGYINFHANYSKLAGGVLSRIEKEKKNYGAGNTKRKKVIVEHTSANPDGPLHIGHSRNSILGDSISRILEYSGYKVTREFWVNDCGRQIALAAWGYLKKPTEPTGKKDYWVVDIYVNANREAEKDAAIAEQISELLKKYEQEDKKTVGAFKKLVDACLEGHVQTLDRLDIKFDNFVWESSFLRDGSTQKLLAKIEKNKKAKKEGQMLAIDLTEYGIEKDYLVRRSDGTVLYTLKDIAYHISKLKRADVLVGIYGADHKLHFQQLLKVLEVLGQKTDNIRLVHYEFISLPEGQMSTRRGTYISVDDLLDESIKRAKAEVDKRRTDLSEKEKEKIAEAVGLGAVRYYIASVSPEKPLFFKWEDALNFEQNSSPALQYAYARTCRILEKADAGKYELPNLTPEEKRLISLLAKFGRVVEKSAEELKPHQIAAYANDLVTAFKKFYTNCRVIGSPEEKFRIALVASTKQVLENALNLLGIEPLEQM